MTHAKRFPKYRLPLPLTLLSAVLLAGGITLLALWCQPNTLRAVLASFRPQPLLVVLNAAPVGLLLLAFTCLFRNVLFSAALVNLFVCTLSIANRIKIEVRDEPVFPRDFWLLKEVGRAIGDYDIRFPWAAIATVLGVTLLLATAGVLIGCRPFSLSALKARRKYGAFAVTKHPSRPRSWLLRLAGAGASLAVLAGLILTVYASNDLYNSFRVSNPYYVPAVFNELGFPYCFCHQFTTYPVDRPALFSRAAAEGWERETPDTLRKAQPINVVMVMNEAFSDITDHPAFAYTAENDPLPNLHALREDPHTIAAGRLVAPNFAAGTANMEFDVLTGIQTNALSATTTSALRVVNRDLDSLFRVFGEAGYHTSYFHPGDDWFYNRENVFRWFGAGKTVFIDEMAQPQRKGRWVTDDYMADLIEAEFEAAMAEGQTLFHYTTTIQNHMSYTADKYGDGYQYPSVPLDTTVSEEVEHLLEVYIEGVRDADAMLGRLWDYFARREEPVVLVFYGDHLPYLGDNQLGYAELGFTEQEHWPNLISYEVPYIIWANEAAAAALDRGGGDLDLDGGRLSASFLGAAVLELTGHAGESAWFSFLNHLRRAAPVVQKQTYLPADGTPTQAADASLADIVAKWRQWSYYKLKYQEFD